MTRALGLVLLLAAGCVVHQPVAPPPVRPPPPPPPVAVLPPVAVTVEVFDERLSPYGAWLVVSPWGRVWQPGLAFVGSDFYPYGTSGRWVYTEAGWVFDSDYPFAWAVFHYGRWVRTPLYGWLWIPGTQWAPAWVAWRTGGAWIGWAPLGPAGVPELHVSAWCFVEPRHFTAGNVHRHHVAEGDFHHAVAVTQPLPPARVAGPPPTVIAGATPGPVVPLPLSSVRSAGRTVPPPPVAPRGTPPPPVAPSFPPGTPPPPTSSRVAGSPPPPLLLPPPAQPSRRAEPPPASVAPPPSSLPPGRLAPPPARAEPPVRFERPTVAPTPQEREEEDKKKKKKLAPAPVPPAPKKDKAGPRGPPPPPRAP